MFRLNFRNKINTWPAFVDLFSNLVIILIFLLIVFVFLWTTTSVFNKRTGVQTIAELKQINAEQTAQINQMNADNEEAMRLLIQARAELLSNQDELDGKNLSIIDIITAYENEVSKVKESDDAVRREVESLRAELAQTIAAKEQLVELEDARRKLQEQMTAQMMNQENQMAEYASELKRLNAALADADQAVLDEQIKYIDMSNRLNKALADKVAELQDMREYQSAFYRAIKIALGNTDGIEADGDRFIIPSDILFTTGSYKLSDSGKKQLRIVSDVIKEMEEKIPSDINWIIRIDGHTDNKPVVPGTRAYANNMQLSLLRATAVMNELVRDGVLKKHLVPSGFGDMYPVAPNTNAANMQQNRRIELQLTNK